MSRFQSLQLWTKLSNLSATSGKTLSRQSADAGTNLMKPITLTFSFSLSCWSLVKINICLHTLGATYGLTQMVQFLGYHSFWPRCQPNRRPLALASMTRRTARWTGSLVAWTQVRNLIFHLLFFFVPALEMSWRYIINTPYPQNLGFVFQEVKRGWTWHNVQHSCRRICHSMSDFMDRYVPEGWGEHLQENHGKPSHGLPRFIEPSHFSRGTFDITWHVTFQGTQRPRTRSRKSREKTCDLDPAGKKVTNHQRGVSAQTWGFMGIYDGICYYDWILGALINYQLNMIWICLKITNLSSKIVVFVGEMMTTTGFRGVVYLQTTVFDPHWIVPTLKDLIKSQH